MIHFLVGPNACVLVSLYNLLDMVLLTTKRAKLLHSLKDPSIPILDNPLSNSVADHTQIRSVLGIMSLKNFKKVSNSQLCGKFSCQIYLKILLTLFVLFQKLQGIELR